MGQLTWLAKDVGRKKTKERGRASRRGQRGLSSSVQRGGAPSAPTKGSPMVSPLVYEDYCARGARTGDATKTVRASWEAPLIGGDHL